MLGNGHTNALSWNYLATLVIFLVFIVNSFHKSHNLGFFRIFILLTFPLLSFFYLIILLFLLSLLGSLNCCIFILLCLILSSIDVISNIYRIRCIFLIHQVLSSFLHYVSNIQLWCFLLFNLFLGFLFFLNCFALRLFFLSNILS